MPLEVAIMIEGQEGLTWATATRRLRFGPLVCPLTFYHPALLAKRAAAVDQLANGRLDLGIGAGWHEGEHRTFGVPFPPLKERIDRLECGARAIRALWEGRPVTLAQPYYPLEAAQSAPRPVNGALRLIVGGKGERRVLKIVAEHADEWNVTRVTRDEFRAKTEVLAQHCRAAGRWRAAGFLYGAPAEIAGELRAWQTAGMSRVMLQLLDMDDRDAIALIAGEILPALRSA